MTCVCVRENRMCALWQLAVTLTTVWFIRSGQKSVCLKREADRYVWGGGRVLSESLKPHHLRLQNLYQWTFGAHTEILMTQILQRCSGNLHFKRITISFIFISDASLWDDFSFFFFLQGKKHLNMFFRVTVRGHHSHEQNTSQICVCTLYGVLQNIQTAVSTCLLSNASRARYQHLSSSTWNPDRRITTRESTFSTMNVVRTGSTTGLF